MLCALSAAAPPPPPAAAGERAAARALVAHPDSDTLAPFALRFDKSYVFEPRGRAAIGYRVLAGVAVAGGDPVGARSAWPAAVEAFLSEADRHGWRPAVLGAGPQARKIWEHQGMRAIPIGDEVVIDVASFSLTGRKMRNVRQAVARTRRAGIWTAVFSERDIASRDRAAALQGRTDGVWPGGRPLDAGEPIGTAEPDGGLRGPGAVGFRPSEVTQYDHPDRGRGGRFRRRSGRLAHRFEIKRADAGPGGAADETGTDQPIGEGAAGFDPQDAGLGAQLRSIHQSWLGRHADQPGREHGFAMNLDAMAEGRHGDALVIVAFAADGYAVSFQRYLTAATDGPAPVLSLDVMPRDRVAPNGVNERLIVDAVEYAATHCYTSVSLNFAAFRTLFEGRRARRSVRGTKGEERTETGAAPDGPRRRAVRRWIDEVVYRAVHLLDPLIQVESLYRFNAKFQPGWLPRAVLVRSWFDLPAFATAALGLEFALPYDRGRLHVPAGADVEAQYAPGQPGEIPQQHAQEVSAGHYRGLA